jgi:hypothetical protein
LKGGDLGVDILMGNSAQSPLIHYVARVVEDLEMPPEGKGEPLTDEEVGILRAWIDQGALWDSTNLAHPFSFTLEPSLRGLFVSGDRQKFREVEGLREGMVGGLEHFEMQEQFGPDTRVTVEGRALFGDPDYRVQLTLQKTGLGFVRGGFEQWRRYYDDAGGTYPGFVEPTFELGRDLHLDLGRAWLDLGLTMPHLPRIIIGYEYQYREGDKSTLAWGSVNLKNIYPAFKEVDERTHVFTLEVTHEWNDWRLDDIARVELYEADHRRVNAAGFNPNAFPQAFTVIKEHLAHVQGMNAFRLQRQMTDWWLISGGYFYSRFEGDYALNQETVDAFGSVVAGRFWSTEPIELERENHMFNVASQLRPLAHLSLSAGLQTEWQRQQALGHLHLDEGNPDLPPLFVLQPVRARSDLDKMRFMEDFGLRYTGIPFTVLFADARFEQDNVSQFEEQEGEGVHAFLRDTDAFNDRRDYRVGFSHSPWRWLSLSAHYRGRFSDTDYDHQRRFVLRGDGYSAFIRHRRIEGDEVDVRMTLRPVRWYQVVLSYRKAVSDFTTTTDPIISILGEVIAPGGNILAGTYDADIYGVNLTVSPLKGLQLSGAFAFTDSRLRTADHQSPSVIPYEGTVYHVMGNATYALNESTRLEGALLLSHGDYGQHNPEGLPLGLNFRRYGVMAGISRRFSERLAASLRYRFYSYAEPTSHHAADYTAHGVFASLNYRWP